MFKEVENILKRHPYFREEVSTRKNDLNCIFDMEGTVIYIQFSFNEKSLKIKLDASTRSIENLMIHVFQYDHLDSRSSFLIGGDFKEKYHWLEEIFKEVMKLAELMIDKVQKEEIAFYKKKNISLDHVEILENDMWVEKDKGKEFQRLLSESISLLKNHWEVEFSKLKFFKYNSKWGFEIDVLENKQIQFGIFIFLEELMGKVERVVIESSLSPSTNKAKTFIDRIQNEPIDSRDFGDDILKPLLFLEKQRIRLITG